MAIELYAGVSHEGVVEVGVDGVRRSDGVALSPEESAVVSAIFSEAGSFADRLHCERRSDAYLSIVGPEYGDDFCRVKASARSLWVSLDLSRHGLAGDPRLDCVKNKRQRHWKIPLESADDIHRLGDLVLLALDSTSLKP